MNALKLFGLCMIVLIVNNHVYSIKYPTIWKCCNVSNDLGFVENITSNANNFSQIKNVNHTPQDSVKPKGLNQKLSSSRGNLFYGKLYKMVGYIRIFLNLYAYLIH